MSQLAKWVERVGGRWRDDALLRNFGWLGLGELVVRLSRLVTAIVLARTLAPLELGLAASAMACFEIVRVFAGNGLTQKVIRATDERLEATCNAAWAIAWLLCGGMLVLHLLIGVGLAVVLDRPQLGLLVAALGAVFLFVPCGVIQGALLLRDGRIGTVATIGTTQTASDNILVALLALLGFGPWAIVLPKLLSAPIWLVGVRWMRPWHRHPEAGHVPWPDVWRYILPVIGSELLVAARMNLDKILVGAILGLNALGIYYFAFNAGYGLSIILTGALASASFPHFADAAISHADRLARFDKALRRLALPIAALIALQAALVSVYVPVLFGARWEPHLPIVAVLCLSAVSKPFFDLSCQLLRATGRPGLELQGSLALSLAMLSAFAVALPFGLMAGVVTLAVVALVLQVVFTAWARSRAGAIAPAGHAAMMGAGA
ncbi:MAG: oligosaccharide flippase family protein [Hyphomicrobiaceae bacterium]